jgi:SAM-dependent methyltransferase
VLLAFHLIEHLRDAGNLLREARRVLTRQGVLAIVTPDWRKQYKSFWRDPTHLRPYDKESMMRLLRMHGFSASVRSWNPRWGLARIRAYRLLPQLGMVGTEILALGTKD